MMDSDTESLDYPEIAEVSEDETRAAALSNPDVKKFVGDLPVRRVIIVKQKLVNVVAK